MKRRTTCGAEQGNVDLGLRWDRDELIAFLERLVHWDGESEELPGAEAERGAGHDPRLPDSPGSRDDGRGS